MKKFYEKYSDLQNMPKWKKVLCVSIGIFLVILKIIALYDLYKNQKSMESINKALWVFFIILIPPAPILYFVITKKIKAKIRF
jgi:hypothetical protein